MIGDGACQANHDRTSDHHSLNEQPQPDDTNNDLRYQERRNTSRNEKQENSKETAIWYEYGCV